MKKDFIEIYTWIHSSLAALSIGYFLSLLSAAPETQSDLSLFAASLFFCISLTANSYMAFILMWFSGDKTFLNEIYPLYPWHDATATPSIAIYSFFIGVFFLLFFYSSILSIAVIITAVAIHIKNSQIYKKCMDTTSSSSTEIIKED